jgi:hypothetical protein
MDSPVPGTLRHTGVIALTLGYAAFVAANLIHNRLGMDIAVLPATLLMMLYLWRPARAFRLGTAVLIALPALAFLKPRAIYDPSDPTSFANHLALLLAGVLAIAGGASALVPVRRTA